MDIESVAITGADQSIAAATGKYHGFSIRETAGATARLKIHLGADATGVLLDVVNFNPYESVREFYDSGILSDGVYVDIESGAVAGAIRYSEAE